MHPGRADDRMTAASPRAEPYRRAVMTTLWRAFSPPPQDWPLALLDYRSVDDAEGEPNLLLFVDKLPDPDDVPDIEDPDAQPAGVDLRLPPPGTAGGSSPTCARTRRCCSSSMTPTTAGPWRVPHTAFEAPYAATANPRASVEIRTIAFFYERLPGQLDTGLRTTQRAKGTRTVTEQLPPDVIAQLTGMGRMITPELVQGSWAVLKPFHEKVGYTAPKIDRDLAYGDHERHRLDVHTSRLRRRRGDRAGAPVLLFVHGGGFVGGDKHVPGTPMYDHIGAWAVRNGWVGVTMTYRLAPEHTWPSGAQDVAAAVAWVRDNIAAYGGDPTGSWWRATRPAACTSPRTWPARAAARSTASRGRACCPASTQIPDGAERGEIEPSTSATCRRRRSPRLGGLLEAEVPLIFAVAENDPPFSHAQVAGLTAAWFARQGHRCRR